MLLVRLAYYIHTGSCVIKLMTDEIYGPFDHSYGDIVMVGFFRDNFSIMTAIFTYNTAVIILYSIDTYLYGLIAINYGTNQFYNIGPRDLFC